MIDKCIPFACNTGDTIQLSKVWDCVIPCTVVGETPEGLPLIQDENGSHPIINELIEEGILKTRGRPGMIPTEVLTLGAYEQIFPEDSFGKTVKAVWSDYRDFLLIFTDRTYIKHTIGTDCDGINMLDSEPLTMDDLKLCGLLSDTEFEQYEKEKETDEENKSANAMWHLKNLTVSLGKEKVISLLETID